MTRHGGVVGTERKHSTVVRAWRMSGVRDNSSQSRFESGPCQAQGGEMKEKTLKVYKVECGILRKEEGDCRSLAVYRITAHDVEEAIEIVKLKFIGDVEIGEYVESVELICYLDE